MKRFGIQESGIGKKRADSLQQTADCERKAGREKRRGIFPLTSDPVRQAHGPERVEGLSLGGARKNKEKGYHRLQGEIAARPLGAPKKQLSRFPSLDGRG